MDDFSVFERPQMALYKVDPTLVLPTTDERLQNSIHPIFAEAKFSGLGQGDYEMLRPALQLATRFFTMDRFAHYADTMIFGRLFADRVGFSKPKRWRYLPDLVPEHFRFGRKRALRCSAFPRHPAESIHRLRRRIDPILKTLENLVTFEITDRYLPHVAAWTEPLPESPPADAHPQLHIIGQQSKILIANDILLELHTVKSELDSMLPLFKFAKILLHELAHALFLAAWARNHDEEFFYKNNQIAEMGFQLKVLMFGGTLLRFWDDQVMTTWPSNIRAHSYKRTKSAIEIRSLTGVHDVCFLVPTQDIVALFRENFWTNTVPALGKSPLLPRPKQFWVFRWDKESSLVKIALPDDPGLPLKYARLLRRIIRRESLEEEEDPVNILTTTQDYAYWDGETSPEDLLATTSMFNEREEGEDFLDCIVPMDDHFRGQIESSHGKLLLIAPFIIVAVVAVCVMRSASART